MGKIADCGCSVRRVGKNNVTCKKCGEEKFFCIACRKEDSVWCSPCANKASSWEIHRTEYGSQYCKKCDMKICRCIYTYDSE
jgi:hypothetical protein